MNDYLTQTQSPELCAHKIFEISGTKFDPDIAADLWTRILQHKWLMSEKLGRDVGLRVACIDFLENMEQASCFVTSSCSKANWATFFPLLKRT